MGNLVLSRNYIHPGVCLEITPTHKKSFPEACQRLKYNVYNNGSMGKVARYEKLESAASENV